jgi:hypothetical protein
MFTAETWFMSLPVEAANFREAIDIEQFKTARKKLDLFKVIIPSILQTKQDELPEDIKTSEYPAFVINRALSQHRDCVDFAQNMNLHPNIPVRTHYVYLLNTVRKGRRAFVGWAKKPKQEEAVEIIAAYSNISRRKAERLVDCVTPAQIEHMKKVLDPGG